MKLLPFALVASVYLALQPTAAAPSRGGTPGTRIIGGVPTLPGEFPYVVSIRCVYHRSAPGKPSSLPRPALGVANGIGRGYGSGSKDIMDICVGTIIAENEILTAAHCVEDYYATDLQVLAGTISLSDEEPAFQQKLQVVNITIHPEYHTYQDTYRYDLAKLHTTGMQLNSRVKPIAKPPLGHTPQGDCWITGWGQTKNSSSSNHLLKAEVPVTKDDDCSRVYQGLLDTKIQVCAGREEGGVDACWGDTGGPLMCRDWGDSIVPYIAGIVSWGESCAKPDIPGVYTRVSSFCDWF